MCFVEEGLFRSSLEADGSRREKRGREPSQAVLSGPVWPWLAYRGLEHESHPGAVPSGATFSSYLYPRRKLSWGSRQTVRRKTERGGSGLQEGSVPKSETESQPAPDAQ